MSTPSAACPRCGSAMVQRYSAKRGSSFLGCSRYPGCRGTRDLGSGATAGRRPRSRSTRPTRASTGYKSATVVPAAAISELAERLSRLVAFYDACLREEGLRDLRFRAADVGDALVPVHIDVAALIQGNSVAVGDAESVGQWVSGRRVGFSGSRFYVGFPLVLVGDPADIAPLMYVPVDLERGANEVSLSLADGPQLNYRILEDAGFTTDEAVEATGAIESRLNDASLESSDSAVRAAILELSSMAGLEVADDLDLSAMGVLDLSVAASGDVQLAAILFASDRLGFTQSTRRELGTLAEDRSAWAGTALETILEGHPPLPLGDNSELVVVSPLSEAQRKAVTSALVNPVTVVTGPPGTGKSELVLNLVANGLVRGETVMVASRNNKAVDVVVERFRGLTDEATMVRVGRAAYRDRAIALMRRVVAGIRPPSEAEVSRAGADLRGTRLERGRLAESARLRAEAEAACERDELAWEEATVGLPQADIEISREFAKAGSAIDVISLTKLRESVEARAEGRRGVLERIVAVVRPLRPLRTTRRLVAEAAESVPSAFTGTNLVDGDWADLVVAARRAEAIAEASVRWHDLMSAVSASRLCSTVAEIGDALVALGSREAAAGRRYVAVERQRALSDLPQEDQRKLSEYLRAVDQLGGSERLGSRMYAKLKGLEGRLFTDVQRVFPVWALTTLTARSNLPLRAGLFDLLIIDEASQCDLPSAFPLLARAKRVVVIGDDKQLIHVTPLRAETEQALAAEHDLTAEELVNYSYRRVSLFTLARHLVSTLPTMTLLDEHYRSHPQIIGFSNDRFYGGRLSVFTEPERIRVATDSDHPAVRWEHISGTTVRPRHGSALNEAEVERVVQVVAGLVGGDGPPLSIGVVTPFRLQKERLTLALARRLDADTLERHHVIADTAHGFQGDERDVMVLSTVVSSGAQPSTIDFVERNPNLFNVAVTRARSLLIVVGDEKVCRARDGLLGELARYAERLRGPEAEGPTREPETDEEALLVEHLTAAGLRPMPQHEVRGLRVDIGLPDDHRPVAIEVDGSSHDSVDGSRLLRDVYRDTKLRRAGWEVIRVPAWRVRLEPSAVVAEVLEATSGRR